MAPDRERWRLGFVPALDGIRALALLAVVAHHAGLVPAGYIGVDVFFVLSGFLITSLLLDERLGTGRIRLGRFWMRRVLRLVPALVIVVSAVAALAWAGAGSGWLTPSAAFAALTFTTNLYLWAGGAETALLHTWSLGVEEQFYLTWPVIVFLLSMKARDIRTIAVVATAGAIIAAIWTELLRPWASSDHQVFGFDARVAPILAGCALGAWMSCSGPMTWRLPRVAAILSLVVLGSMACGLGRQPLTTIATVLLILVALGPTTSGRTLLEWRWLRWIGQRSYGAYLWHLPIVLIVRAVVSDAPGIAFSVGLVLTLGAAALSYRLVERPILVWGHRRFASR